MGWTSKDFDPDVLSSALLTIMKQHLSKASGIQQTKDPDIEATDIVEYEGRMRVSGLEKLNNICYIAAVNFYLTKADADKQQKTKGVLVLYMEMESAGKFFKALEIPFREDEDDASMMEGCGRFAQIVAEGLNKEISAKGYAPLVLSGPTSYKNNVMEGVAISPDQKTKHEIGYFYFKHKAIAVELSLAPLPKK